METFFIGIDIGTQGARVVMLDAEGAMAGSREEAFPLSVSSREEQSPQEWWDVCSRLLRGLVEDVRGSVDVGRVRAVAVTSTSGTVIPLDGEHEPLYPAIMYSDPRSAEAGARCKAAALRWHPGGYSGFNASSGLSKMVWFAEQFPEKARLISKWVHAADFITGKLCGRWGVTDYTNALKSGYDVREKIWPAYIYERLPVRREWLPEVLPSGEPIGVLLGDLSASLGLGADVRVVTGMTDGCASQVASGAVNVGDWNTTIGTTMVVKGVTKQELIDPGDRLYSHRHPEGYWMPGGASNTGGDWVSRDFSGDLAALNKQAGLLMPTGQMAWPLLQQGERFPFMAPQARGFAPSGLSEAELFTANMEGVAYVERYAYELIRQLSGEEVRAVFTAGGGSQSEPWLLIRSSVLNLPIYKMKYVSGAVGAAILAASRTFYQGLTEAGRAMTVTEKKILPVGELVGAYEEGYRQFLKILQDKGYV
ncbi:MAG TPA: FGGY-family carbohydrate kinase [Puia sp.]|nr:FGGY-family carbohydrate kinase [Puia sp.]